MTTADMFRAEGRTEGRAEALLQQLNHKFGPLSRAVLDRVRAASTGELESWTTHVLTADTLDDVLRT
ncbi:DUF4351 domain-containing protein [Phytoactinopolyspora endophytica]|uniref:DUF4351 domain-containing protein n=1 Tax=Phytoactinopolyspora endophytica TaxID=1642495 RepID=UPI00101D68E3|nr:DUF4351 domain-containing protein [Phytoactinopolyspora endophytica]